MSHSDPVMSQTYRILCFIEGGEYTFAVEIASDETVHELKKEIKKKESDALAGIDVDTLELYHVAIKVYYDEKGESIGYVARVREQMSKSQLPPQLRDSTRKLVDIFNGPPPENTLHILIRRPQKAYTINCILEDGKDSFVVNTTILETVYGLKEEIKKEVSIALAGIDAYRLELYHVNILAHDPEDSSKDVDYVAKAREEMSKPQLPPKLCDPARKLVDVFNGPPPNDTLHIFVRRPEIYTIFCMVEGEYREFPIKIASDQTVDALKKEIKKEVLDISAGIDAHRLKLYHIEITTYDPRDTSKDIDYVAKAREEMSKPVLPPELDPQDEMAEIFKGTPPEDTIHIIVRRPEIYSVFCMVEVEGEYYEIPVEIASDQTVDKLKKEIKMQLFRTLAGIDAHRLKLYHIEIPTFGPQDTSKDVDYVAKAREEMSKPVLPPELDPQDKMMEIFKGTPPEDTIHIIVRCPPEIYTIFCLIEGEDIAFSVEIASDQTVDELKKEIGKEALAGIDASTLKLYHVGIPTYDRRDTRKDIDYVAKAREEMRKPYLPPELKIPAKKLSFVFKGTPPKLTIHIIVRCPLDTVGKRKHGSSDIEDSAAKRVKRIKGIPSLEPLSIKFKHIAKRIGSDKVAYNRPRAHSATIPIALTHPVFAKFLQDYQHHEPTDKDNNWLRDLQFHMLKEYREEGYRTARFREIFEANTGIWIPDASLRGTTHRTNGYFECAGHVLLIIVAKNEWVNLLADPQLQAFTQYIEYVKKKTEDKAFKGSPLPCLIIYYVGSLIGFAGAVTTNKPQFEVLTPLFDLATNSHDTLALKPIARALGATRAALGSLKEYYIGLKQGKPASSVDPKFPSRTYYTNRDGTKVEFEYQSRLDNEKLLFLVLNRPEEQILLVKFTQKYSEEAHAHCASHGVAPELYAVEQLGGGWMMVVMEYLDEDVYTHMYELRASRRASLRTAVTDAVSTLHQGNFVHGDIRHVNMLVSRTNGVKLIDFDWAGPEGTTRYPANVNHEGIRRPEDARDGQLITREHDMMMVGFIFD